jgi:cytoskeletal protein CcmA (bactofilin family)
MEFFQKKEKTSGRIPMSSELNRLSEATTERAAATESAPVPRPRATAQVPVPQPEAVARPAAPSAIAETLDDVFSEAQQPMARPEPVRAEALPPPRPTSAPIPREIPREALRETVINADASFKGDFSSDGAMRIDGKVEGKVSCKGRLTVGKGAQVVGEANVAQAVIDGTVNGNITAAERVELASSARVTGDIRAPRLVVGEGASLQGHVSIGVDASSTPATSEKPERSGSGLSRSMS